MNSPKLEPWRLQVAEETQGHSWHMHWHWTWRRDCQGSRDVFIQSHVVFVRKDETKICFYVNPPARWSCPAELSVWRQPGRRDGKPSSGFPHLCPGSWVQTWTSWTTPGAVHTFMSPVSLQRCHTVMRRLLNSYKNKGVNWCQSAWGQTSLNGFISGCDRKSSETAFIELKPAQRWEAVIKFGCSWF